MLLVVCCVLLPARIGMADGSRGLEVQYIDFPPYYYPDAEGRPDGFLLKLARHAFERAGVPVLSWECLPAKRVLVNLQLDRPLVSIGWFWTPERESVYKFSRLLYENKQLRAVYLKKQAARFEGRNTLADLLRDKKLRLGLLDGYSLGPTADAIIRREKPDAVRVVGGYGRMIGMLAEERFAYLLMSPEAIESLIRKNHLNPAIFESQPLADVIEGNKRYLMYSRAVPDEWIRRIDNALKELPKE
ncbi:transporter substrate-binding domain-containing protein [Pseudodesulfovibrio sp.]|uniref:substrate-binding periplasmic protein n=1 Tax=Pseudodesulfovibrio sp. TaxID=2035812 RepID=UPI002629CE17|nr:transporter substrate-binding domain-containing protein [Pseudodesulfovibrio sp.]MDD3313388.1 transporter substrate-binding domain-containing protein [Pseudodesulfovibrio sp.]